MRKIAIKYTENGGVGNGDSNEEEIKAQKRGRSGHATSEAIR